MLYRLRSYIRHSSFKRCRDTLPWRIFAHDKQFLTWYKCTGISQSPPPPPCTSESKNLHTFAALCCTSGDPLGSYCSAWRRNKKPFRMSFLLLWRIALKIPCDTIGSCQSELRNQPLYFFIDAICSHPHPFNFFVPVYPSQSWGKNGYTTNTPVGVLRRCVHLTLLSSGLFLGAPFCFSQTTTATTTTFLFSISNFTSFFLFAGLNLPNTRNKLSIGIAQSVTKRPITPQHNRHRAPTE